MTTLNFQTPASDASYPTAGLMPPHWVGEWAGDVVSSDVEKEDRRLQVRRGGRGTLLTVRCVDAAHASPEKLEAETIRAYRTIRRALEQSPHCHPVRLWNHLPQIHQRMDEGRDRYMVFNGGRFKEYCQWWGGPQEFPEHLPTASGLGHHGADLVIHCLAMEAPGIAVENPRQVPAFGYSKRYGPLPPCFARATLLAMNEETLLLLGGTASIVGEQSMHLGDLPAQAEETLLNMAAVVQAAARRIGASPEPSASEALEAFSSLRVYHPNLADRDWIERAMRQRFDASPHIEFVQADLCRSELLIEIEGVARLRPH